MCMQHIIPYSESHLHGVFFRLFMLFLVGFGATIQEMFVAENFVIDVELTEKREALCWMSVRYYYDGPTFLQNSKRLS